MLSATAWLVFIRSGSKRFPNKCYRSILGKNVFQRLSERAISAEIKSQDIQITDGDTIKINSSKNIARLISDKMF